MKRVTGIGGIFFKSHDPAALAAWYRKHLGLDVQTWGGVSFESDGGATNWCAMKADTDYFAPSTAHFMVNYRVADLHGLIAALRAEGCEVVGEPQDAEYGKFGWVLDCDGNKVELWEPPPGA